MTHKEATQAVRKRFGKHACAIRWQDRCEVALCAPRSWITMGGGKTWDEAIGAATMNATAIATAQANEARVMGDV